MPKKLQEIRNLNGGTVTNVDEKDLSPDVSSYALNVNPNSKQGVLEGINADVLRLSDSIPTKTTSTIINGLSNINTWVSSTGPNKSQYKIQDISVFDSGNSHIVTASGLKGLYEKLEFYNVEPILNTFKCRYEFTNTGDATFKPLASITAETSEISYQPSSQAITIVSGLASAFAKTDFVDGTATITISETTNIATTITNLDGGKFKFTSPTNNEITYTFDASGSYVTGQAINTSECCININGAANIAAIAAEVQFALQSNTQNGNSNASLGHGFEIEAEISAAVVTATFTFKGLGEEFDENSYIALHNDNNANSFLGRSNKEIIKIVSIDTDNNTMQIERGLFGTLPLTYSSSAKYILFCQMYLIDGEMISTNEGTVYISDWSNVKGNNLQGNSLFHFGGVNHYWQDASSNFNESFKRMLGYHDCSSANITFSSTDNSMSGTSINDVLFPVGSKVTLFYSGATDDANNGKTLTIIEKSSNKIKFKESITSNSNTTITSGILYIEGGLIKNGSFSHAISETNTTVGASQIYKVNKWYTSQVDWVPDAPGIAGNQEYTTNQFEQTTDTVVSQQSNNGVTQDTRSILGSSHQSNKNYYPFPASDKPCIKIDSTFKRSGQTWTGITLPNESGTTIVESELYTFWYTFSANDILLINSEYMKVLEVEEHKISLERGFNNSSTASHVNPQVNKNISVAAGQTISKENLTKGSTYALTFYAKGSATGVKGYLSLKINNTYINSLGNIEENPTSLTSGLLSSQLSNTDYAMQSRWIPFEDLDYYYNDYSTNEYNNNRNVDSVFRRYKVLFTINEDINTDLEIEFSSRGNSTTFVNIDYVDMYEEENIYLSSDAGLITSTSFINKKGLRDLVTYNTNFNNLSVYENFNPLTISNLSKMTINKSRDASNVITSSSSNMTSVSSNKELHLAFGSGENDTSPQWLGYPMQKVFGIDYSKEIYQDEDTVHTFKDGGAYSLDKICLAGEYEYISATWDGTDLEVTMPSSNPHGLIVGDNIVVREYNDTDNSWIGNGVWYVKTLDGTTPLSKFKCRRFNSGTGAKDRLPITGPRNEKISWRPYYYFGIKKGVNHIFRITPDTRITDTAALDTTYVKGTIQKSAPLAFNPETITCCYSKASDGHDGGKVYVMDDDFDDKNKINIYVISCTIPYNEWTNTDLTVVPIFFKPHSYNTNTTAGNGVDRNNTSMKGVPVNYAGTPCSILETKASNKNFDLNTTSNTTNTPSAFDTRLWVACKGTFQEGDRFLFCAHTDQLSNISASAELIAGDRTPPTFITGLESHGNYGTGTPGGKQSDIKMSIAPFESTNIHDLWTHQGSWPDGATDDSRNATIRLNDGLSQVVVGYSWIRSGNVVRNLILGENIGWKSPNRTFDSGVSITIKDDCIMPISDNDGDGIIDGTGLVTANTTSITRTSQTIDDKLIYDGEYGYEGLRVSSHCVGLLGDCNGNEWIQKSGGLTYNSSALEDDDARGDLSGLSGAGTRTKTIQTALFTCPDIFYGDYRWQSTLKQNGDMYGRAISTVSGLVGGGPLDGQENTDCYNAQLRGAVNGYTSRHTDPEDGSYTYDSESYQTLANRFTQRPNIAYDSDLYTKREEDNAPGFYAPTWFSAPNQLLPSQGNYETLQAASHDDFWEGSGVSSISNYSGLTITDSSFSNMPMTARVDKLNYRSGVTIRPLIHPTDHSTIDFNGTTAIEGITTPNPIPFKGALTEVTGLSVDEAVTATESSDTIDVDNGSGSKYNADINVLKAVCLNNTLYKSDGSIIGLCTSVDASSIDAANQHKLTFAEGVQTDVSDGDAIYVKKIHYGDGSSTAREASKVIISSSGDIDDNSYSITVLEPKYVNTQQHINDSIVTSSVNSKFTDSQGILSGTADAGNYLTSSTGNCEFKTLFATYGCLALEEADITGGETGQSGITYGLNGGISPALDDGNSGTTSKLYKSTVFSYGFGAINKLVGQMLVITDVTNQTTHMRYIIGSEWNHTDSKLYLVLHYPLNIDTSNMQWKIVHHSTSCVNNLFLDVHKYSSDAQKTISGQENVYNLACFGGLDMRKTISHHVTTTDFTTDAAKMKVTIHPTGALAQNVIVGDTIEINGSRDESDGVYAVESIAGDIITVTNSYNANDTGYDDNFQKLMTNQTELVTIDRSGTSSIAEARIVHRLDSHANASVYDVGDSMGNILASTPSNQYVKAASTAALTLALSSTGGSDNSYFQTTANATYTYKVSLIYDGYQEGPIGLNTYSPPTISTTKDHITLTLKIAEFSKRLTDVCVYRRDNDESFYRLVKQINTKSGWAKDADDNYTYTFNDTGELFGTYESRTGLNETVTNIKIKYGLSTEIDGYLFAADCSNDNIKDASNQIFRSKPGKYSIFDWTRDFIILKSTPTAITNFNGRLFVFDENNTYRINQHTLQIEDIYEGVGCLNQRSVVVTEKGMFFASATGAYMHNGQTPVQISSAIWKGKNQENWDNASEDIMNISWQNLFSDSVYKDCKVIYDTGNDLVLYFISVNIYNSKTSKNELKNLIWSYSLKLSRWDLWNLSSNQNIGTPFKGKEGQVFVPIDGSIFELGASEKKKPFTFISKKLSLSEDSIVKVYNKIKINNSNMNLNTDSSNNQSLLIKTNNGDVANSDIVFVDKGTDAEFKLSGYNKKGRWIQLVLEGIEDRIDSIGIIHRRKTTK